jgi:hypothetical protein
MKVLDELVSITLPRAEWIVLHRWLKNDSVGFGFTRIAPDEVVVLQNVRALIIDAIRTGLATERRRA